MITSSASEIPVLSKRLSTWSATPTPLDEKGGIDVKSVAHTLLHHRKLGCEGVMLAGTCGEGPWLSHSDIEELVRVSLEHSDPSLAIAVQVTDNSPRLVLERLEKMAGLGVKMGVLAQPYFLFNATPARLASFYREILDHSPLPIIFYDRGKAATVPVQIEILGDIVGHPKVIAIKDSSADAARFAIMSAERTCRPELRIMTGDEFQLIPSLRAGYDGAFFGGMILTGLAVRRCFDLFAKGNLAAAEQLDSETRQLLFDVYGGPKITCWLSGLKYALVRLGVFTGWTNILDYPLTDDCRRAIDQAVDQIGWLHPEE